MRDDMLQKGGKVVREMNVKSQQNARDYLYKVYEQEHANYFKDLDAMACIAECFSEFLNANIGVQTRLPPPEGGKLCALLPLLPEWLCASFVLRISFV
eukprot:2868622-Amphidinium_carterae.1